MSHFDYVDVDGDGPSVHSAYIPGKGPGGYFRISPQGCSISVGSFRVFSLASSRRSGRPSKTTPTTQQRHGTAATQSDNSPPQSGPGSGAEPAVDQ